MKRQRFLLDRLQLAAYLALAVSACGPNLGPTLSTVVPVDMAPADASRVEGWVAATEPTTNRAQRFKWVMRQPDENVGGSGSARIAPPDSLRLDMAGPLGAKRTAGMVIGDEEQWVSREDVLDKIIPSYPLLWAMLGVARRPPAGALLRAAERGDSLSWEYAAAADTVEYVRVTGPAPSLTALVRQEGRIIGRVETMLGANGLPVASRLFLPNGPSRLDITFTEVSTPATFKPDIWAPPER